MNIEQARQKIKEAIRNNEAVLNLDSYKDNEKLSSADLITLLPDILKLNLERFDCDANQISDISVIAELKNLQSLFLNENQISDISAIAELKNLQTLYLAGNQISDISAIAELKHLQSLSLAENQISDISVVAELKNLQTLHLDENQISDISVILKLEKLEFLSLFNNQFKEIPKEITNLSNLKSLYLDENQLEHSAAVIVQLKNTNLIILDGEGFKPIPLEISSNFKNERELLDYYFKTLKGEGRELNEAKVLVVGEANVGKTSLILRLITGKYDPKRNPTKGIQIYKDWKVPVNEREVQLNVWDFGGQEIMHATHQFFLTKRSLYILMLDATVDKEGNRIEYWLEKIRILGGGSPVLIVINKIDLHQLDVNQSGLLKKYPNIRGFYPVSCEKGDGLPELKAALVNEAGRLGGIHDVLPASWFAVKEELEKIDADFISNERYEEICRRNEVEEEDWERLITLLHDLGVVLSFREGALAHDTSVLNPEWVTQGVYDIINSPELFKTKGVLTREMLARILDRRKYPVNKQLFIVEMMQKFELCFEIKAREEFLVPDLLSEEELNTGNWDDSLRFEYQYNILFGSIISRFIVKMHKSISKTTYWRTGVVLEYVINGKVKNEALVTADTAKRKITIAIRGYENTRREFLSRIREKFEEIYDSFPREFKENVAEKVPIPKNPEIVVDYKNLLDHEELGAEFIIPEGLPERFPVKDLLNGIESEEERIKQRGNGSISAPATKVEEDNQAIVERNEKEIAEVEKRFAIQKNTKEICDRDAEESGNFLAKAFAFTTALVHIVSFAVLIYLIFFASEDGWNNYEKWTFAIFVGLELLNLLFSSVFFIKTSKEFSWSVFRDSLIENRRQKKYLVNNFDVHEYEGLEQKLQKLKVNE